MHANKRALALWLGLFFYILFPLNVNAQDSKSNMGVSGTLSAETGTLWVENDGAAFYRQSGIELGINKNIFFGFDIAQVNSNLELLDMSILGFKGRLEYSSQTFGFSLSTGSLSHSSLYLNFDSFNVFNKGGKGHFVNLSVPLRFNFLTFTPFLLYANASWDDGDMYYFFGKPKIPSFIIYGLNIGLDLFYSFKHSLGAYGISSKIEIVSNQNDSLFNSGLEAGIFFYQLSLERMNLNFSAMAGFIITDIFLKGALTSANQPFFLFPYLFYNVDSFFKAQAGFAMFHLRHNIGIFRYSLDLGVFHIFNDNGNIDLHYKMKSLFGGSESSKKMNLDIQGLGAAFLSINAGFPALPLSKKINFSLELQKIFAVPWGFGKLSASFTGAGGNAVGPSSLLKTILLSGLSITGKISW